jgi:hypothetical protein
MNDEKPPIRSLLLFNKHYKSKHRDLPCAVRPVPYSEKLSVPKPPENLTCSDDNSDSHENHRQHEGSIVGCDPTFE